MADLIRSAISKETVNCTAYRANLTAPEIEAILLDAVMTKSGATSTERAAAKGEVKFAIRHDKDADVYLLDAAAVTVMVDHVPAPTPAPTATPTPAPTVAPKV